MTDRDGRPRRQGEARNELRAHQRRLNILVVAGCVAAAGSIADRLIAHSDLVSLILRAAGTLFIFEWWRLADVAMCLSGVPSGIRAAVRVAAGILMVVLWATLLHELDPSRPLIAVAAVIALTVLGAAWLFPDRIAGRITGA